MLCAVYIRVKKQSVPDRILPRLIILPFFYSTRHHLSTPRTNSIQRESSVSTPTPSTTPEVNSSQQQQLNSAAASEPVASTITNEVVQEVKAVASRLEPYRYVLYVLMILLRYFLIKAQC